MKRIVLVLFSAVCFLAPLSAQSDSGRARIALFEPAGQRSDQALTAVLNTVADSVELSLDVLQRYDVRRLPPADPEKDLARVKAYCQANRIDQAIMGSGTAKAAGGYLFKLVVYDRRSDAITLAPEGASTGALDMFDVTDKLVGTLLDGLNGSHLLFGSLSIESTPPGAAVSVNGKDVGAAPLSLRGLPTGSVQVSVRLAGYEDSNATLTIADGESTDAPLILARSTGTLALMVPKDAAVSVRSTEIGQKDFTGPAGTTLPTGDYDVQARSPGMPAVSGKVTIARGASAQWLPWPKGYVDVQAAAAGATIVVDGVERGVAPLVVDVTPGALHHIELRKAKFKPYVADLTPPAADKTSLSAEMVPMPGSIRVETSIPGASVKLDNYQQGTTPFVFKDVEAGDHVVEISNVTVGKRLFTIGDPVDVQVNPDETAVVSKTFAEGRGQLIVQDAPQGSVVQVDGQAVDSEKVLSTGIDVPAGYLDVTIMSPDSGKWTSAIEVDPGKAIASSTHVMTFALPRRTIALDGKLDSWSGIQPQTAMIGNPAIFMGDPKIAMAQIYICRDDKYLYWRVDFAGSNPVLKPPRGTQAGLDCILIVQLGRQTLNLGVNFWEPSKRPGAFVSTWDDIKKQLTVQNNSITADYKNTDTTLVARYPLSELSKRVKAPAGILFLLGNEAANHNMVDRQDSETRLIDFFK
jgi:hypothetical protein